jgi:membrane associated rhomboid family serine protease
LLGLTMGRYGTGAGLLAGYLAGAGGNALSWLLSDTPHLSLGASGMVMGSLGLIAIQSLSMLRQKLPSGTANSGSRASRSARSDLLQRTAEAAAASKPDDAPSVPTRPSSAARYLVGGILGGVMLFVLLGLSPGTDIVAHAGGFMSGLVLGGILTLAPVSSQKSLINLLCGIVFVLLVIVPWWLALARG